MPVEPIVSVEEKHSALLPSESKVGKTASVLLSRPRYYTAQEVSLHNTRVDCWVSLFGRVLNLTKLVEEHNGPLCLPIVKFAGEDISFWFDATTHEPKTCIDETTHDLAAYTPHGRYIHIPAAESFNDATAHVALPWWRDNKYVIGQLSTHVRSIRLINTLTAQEDVIKVCKEETLLEIQERYLKHNAHSKSYIWKHLGRTLDMKSTLDENGIQDDEHELNKLILASADAEQVQQMAATLGTPVHVTDPAENLREAEWKLFIPAIHLYFIDDLTVA